MDESHRYRASAGVRAINELKPILGLELTATPFVETSRGGVPFKNVIYDYPLGRAMADGFVKEPAVVTRKDFNPAGMSPEEIERLKLEDGIRLHESVKVELETYARESGNAIIIVKGCTNEPNWDASTMYATMIPTMSANMRLDIESPNWELCPLRTML